MRVAWWLPKATNTHSECAMLIAFPQQQLLKERASMLRYTLLLHYDKVVKLFYARLVLLCDFELNYRLQVPLVRYESKLQGGNCGSPPPPPPN